MKIFIDTADAEEIKKANDWGIVNGVTTNPSLIAKENKERRQIIKEIIGIINGPISVEVISTNAKEMTKEAIMISEWSENIVIKIPMITEGLKTVKALNSQHIKTNVTLIFSTNQALLAAKAGATYASIFVGRLDDIGHDGMQIVRDTMEMYKLYNFKTEVIVASIRHPLHIVEAAKIGAHVVTVPFNIIEKMYKHPLTDIGLKKFLEDWKK